MKATSINIANTMKTICSAPVIAVASFTLGIFSFTQAGDYSKRNHPFQFAETNGSILDDAHRATGLLTTPEGRGTGSVVGSRRVIFTAAHVLWGSYTWQSTRGFRFYPGYHSGSAPSSGGKSIAGFRYWTSYSNDNDGRLDRSEATYDFAMMYTHSDVISKETYPIPYASPGKVAVQSPAPKVMMGYPAVLHHNGAKGYTYQHTTTTYDRAVPVVANRSYQFANGVTTGPGNSGGPVLSAEYRLDYFTSAVLGWEQLPWYYVGHVIGGSSSTTHIRVFDDWSSTMLRNLLNANSSVSLVWGTHVAPLDWGKQWAPTTSPNPAPAPKPKPKPASKPSPKYGSAIYAQIRKLKKKLRRAATVTAKKKLTAKIRRLRARL